MNEEFPKGPKWMSGMSDNWTEVERKHELEIKKLELEERMRLDGMKQWRYKTIRKYVALLIGGFVIASVFIFFIISSFNNSKESAKLDHERWLACINAGGTPVQTDNDWMCLYLQKEPS